MALVLHLSAPACFPFRIWYLRWSIPVVVHGILFACLLIPSITAAQQTRPVILNGADEQQLEQLTELNEDIISEDDAHLQLRQQFLRHPLNLNEPDISSLSELMVCSPVQIQQIIRYRNLLGNFIHLYELQAVPGLDLASIEQLLPYISIHQVEPVLSTFHERMKGGNRALLLRMDQVLEKQKGFRVNPGAGTNYYPGSRQRVFWRYKYQFKNLLQYGILGEKDAGEQFFKGAQQFGFDFYSAHFFARDIGSIRSLALGDFTVNLGQGLIQWQSMAFKKGGDISNAKRQMPVLRPYNSAGEINFHRGAGVTIAGKQWETTLFISYKKVDANLVLDTLHNENFITSFQAAGLHRTNSETYDKGVQRQLAFGGNLVYHFKRGRIGFNGIQYHFKLPVQKPQDPYNLFAWSGNNFGNYSADYSYGYKNLHLFGEVAITNRLDMAWVNGLLISADSKIDLSLLYRNISKSYQSMYSNAFTEGGVPNNEKGLYMGISIRPHAIWRVEAYADFFTSNWLKYLVDAPAAGTDYQLQATCKPNKRLEIFIRYQAASKAKNLQQDSLLLTPVIPVKKQSVRYNLGYTINKMITLRNRVEICWFNQEGKAPQSGFLTYLDCVVKPLMKPYAGSVRFVYFKTAGYDSRIYTYENDVLYSFSIPVFYDKGIRYYINFNYDLTKKVSVWIKWAQTVYRAKTTIGTGLDEIAGNKRSTIKLQLRYLF